MRRLKLHPNHLALNQLPCLPRRSSIKAALRRTAKAFYRAITLAVEGGLVLFSLGQLLIRDLRVSIIAKQLVINDVPFFIILAFLQDRIARRAYFRKDAQAVHDRLCRMGIEERIKDFYRPQISDEVELDRYIHQILYEQAGYVGKDYRVNKRGILELKKGNKF